jgi:hypothetical protein
MTGSVSVKVTAATCAYCKRPIVTGHRVAEVVVRLGVITPVHGYRCADALKRELAA